MAASGIGFLSLAILATFCVSASANAVQEKVAIADIALVIDQSASIKTHYREELDFAKKFVNSFPIGVNETRFALLQFSFSNMTHVRLPWNQGTSKEKIMSAIDSMENDTLGAGTDFTRALAVAYEQVCQPNAGDRPDVPNILVMVTDGFFNNPWEKKTAADAAGKLRSTGVLMYAIQVQTDPSLPPGDGPVQDLALLTGNRSRVFAVENWDKLTNDLLGQITHQINVEYADCVYEYVPVGACYQSPAGKCVADGDLVIERLPQTRGKPCPTRNRTQIDCQESDGCRTGGKEENAVNAVSVPKAEKEVRAADVGGASKFPVWAIAVIAAIAGLILILIVAAIIIRRTPRWRAVFTPSKPKKPQLPGTTEDSKSMGNHATLPRPSATSTLDTRHSTLASQSSNSTVDTRNSTLASQSANSTLDTRNSALTSELANSKLYTRNQTLANQSANSTPLASQSPAQLNNSARFDL